MNESTITVQGYVGSDPVLRSAAGHLVVNFRVACTPRRRNRATGEWADQRTQWYTVTAWRQLAENVANSVQKGDPVLVHGRMLAREWTNQEGRDVSELDVEALVVGHDLSRGRTVFEKVARAAEAAPASSGVPTEPDERGRAMEQAWADWGAPYAEEPTGPAHTAA